MPVARPTRPLVAHGARAAGILKRGLAPVLRSGGRAVGGAGSWAEALAQASSWNPGSITRSIAPGLREVLGDVDRTQLRRFRRAAGRFTGFRTEQSRRLHALRSVTGLPHQRAVLRATGYAERLPAVYKANLENRLAQLSARGAPFSEARLHMAIRQSQGVARNRARLIGFDQVETRNGELARLRQLAIGVDRFEIVTAGDRRVRPEHAREHGNVYAWDGDPPYIPGAPIGCRCGAAAVFGARPATTVPP